MANNLNPVETRIASPCPGRDSVSDCNNGTRTDITSIGAKSKSSSNSQWPSMTACVNTPGCQTNSPGISVHLYVPSNDYKENQLLLETKELRIITCKRDGASTLALKPTARVNRSLKHRVPVAIFSFFNVAQYHNSFRKKIGP